MAKAKENKNKWKSIQNEFEFEGIDRNMLCSVWHIDITICTTDYLFVFK